MPLVFAGGGIEYDDAAVAIAVGDIDFIGGGINGSLRRLAGLGGVVSGLGGADLADLHHELAVAGEFYHHIVVVRIAGEPDKSLVVDLDAMLAADPFIA